MAGPIQTAAHQVLGTTELLEIILGNLKMNDVLCNAQRVGKFWKECIAGSLALQRKCFLASVEVPKGEIDSILFLQVEGPQVTRFIRQLRLIHRPHFPIIFHSVLSPHDCYNAVLRAARFRRCLMKNPWNFSQYTEYLTILYAEQASVNMLTLRTLHNALYDNTGHEYMFKFVRNNLLNMSCLHPFLKRNFGPEQNCTWTGYKDHLYLHLGLWMRDGEYHGLSGSELPGHVIKGIFAEIRKSEPKATWRRALATRPIATRLTVHLGTKEESSSCKTIHNPEGIEVKDVCSLIATTLKTNWFHDANVRHWLDFHMSFQS